MCLADNTQKSTLIYNMNVSKSNVDSKKVMSRTLRRDGKFVNADNKNKGKENKGNKPKQVGETIFTKLICPQGGGDGKAKSGEEKKKEAKKCHICGSTEHLKAQCPDKENSK